MILTVGLLFSYGALYRVRTCDLSLRSSVRHKLTKMTDNRICPSRVTDADVDTFNNSQELGEGKDCGVAPLVWSQFDNDLLLLQCLYEPSGSRLAEPSFSLLGVDLLRAHTTRRDPRRALLTHPRRGLRHRHDGRTPLWVGGLVCVQQRALLGGEGRLDAWPVAACQLVQRHVAPHGLTEGVGEEPCLLE